MSSKRRVGLKDEVAVMIREQIFSGKLRRREKIDQDALSAELEVSRLPVREAIIILENESLITQIPRRGAFVGDITRDDILDHWTMWAMVSGIAARRAAEKIKDAELDTLRAMISREASTTSDDQHYALSNEFHQEINRLGASGRLRAELRSLSRAVPARLNTQFRNWDLGHEEHEQLLDAFKQRDGLLAQSIMIEHLSRSGTYAVRALEDQGFWREDPTDDQ